MRARVLTLVASVRPATFAKLGESVTLHEKVGVCVAIAGMART